MKKTLENTLSTLVSIPSLSSDSRACREVIAYVRQEIEPFGLHITADINRANPWFIASTKKTKTPKIMLACHLDVVPAPPEMFTMRKVGDQLRGRGVYDMKLAAACYIEFIKKQATHLQDLDIAFLFTTDEEQNSACMPDIIEAGWRPDLVFIPDGGDNWQIEQRAKGFVCVQLTATGRAAHGSRPWEGDNALHRLMDVLHIIRHHYPSHEEPTKATLSVNELHAGMTHNQVAEEAIVKIDFRAFSHQELVDFMDLIERLCAEYTVEHSIINHGEPVILDKDNASVRQFLQAFATYTQKEAAFCDSYGGSDARFFAAVGVPCIVVEPIGGGRHAPNEWLLASDLVRYYSLIEQWLLTDTVSSTARLSHAARSPINV